MSVIAHLLIFSTSSGTGAFIEMDQPSTSYGCSESHTSCRMEEDTELADQRVRDHTVELSLLSGDPAYNSMQFNRCMSFEARSSLPNRSADSQIWRCMDDSSSDSGLSESAWRNQSFQPFEMEEQATEVTFLRGQLTKKVRRSMMAQLSHSLGCPSTTRQFCCSGITTLNRSHRNISIPTKNLWCCLAVTGARALGRC